MCLKSSNEGKSLIPCEQISCELNLIEYFNIVKYTYLHIISNFWKGSLLKLPIIILYQVIPLLDDPEAQAF